MGLGKRIGRLEQWLRDNGVVEAGVASLAAKEMPFIAIVTKRLENVMEALEEKYMPQQQQHTLQEQRHGQSQLLISDTMTDVTANTGLSRMGTGITSTFSPYV